MIGGTVLRRAKKALETGIINKREFNAILKAPSGRIANKNAPHINILLERIKQTEPGTTRGNRKAALSQFAQTTREAQKQRLDGASEIEVRRKLLKTAQPTFDAANKRLRRLADIEAKGIRLPSLVTLRQDIPSGYFSSAGKNVDAIIDLYRIAVRFMSDDTSTLKGASKYIRQSMDSFGGTERQATQRRRLVDDLIQDRLDINLYADFTMWLSNNITAIEQFDEGEVRRKVEEIEERKRQAREEARRKASEKIGKPKLSSSQLRKLLED